MSIAEMAAHIEKIAADHGIEINGHSRGGRAYRRGKKIHIRSVKSQITYFVALHELAHVLGPRQASMNRLESEAAAWQWALDNAIVEPTVATYARMFKALDSYLQWAVRRRLYSTHPEKKGAPVIPEEGTHFWEIHEFLKAYGEVS